MSKNISKLSGRIGLKDNLFQKISERSLNSKNGDGMQKNIMLVYLQYTELRVFTNF